MLENRRRTPPCSGGKHTPKVTPKQLPVHRTIRYNHRVPMHVHTNTTGRNGYACCLCCKNMILHMYDTAAAEETRLVVERRRCPCRAFFIPSHLRASNVAALFSSLPPMNVNQIRGHTAGVSSLLPATLRALYIFYREESTHSCRITQLPEFSTHQQQAAGYIVVRLR